MGIPWFAPKGRGIYNPCYHLFSQAAHTACLSKCQIALLQNNGCKTVTAYWRRASQKDSPFLGWGLPVQCAALGMYSKKALPAPLIVRLFSVGGSSCYFFLSQGQPNKRSLGGPIAFFLLRAAACRWGRNFAIYANYRRGRGICQAPFYNFYGLRQFAAPTAGGIFWGWVLAARGRGR